MQQQGRAERNTTNSPARGIPVEMDSGTMLRELRMEKKKEKEEKDGRDERDGKNGENRSSRIQEDSRPRWAF